jgi:hypothetical protein
VFTSSTGMLLKPNSCNTQGDIAGAVKTDMVTVVSQSLTRYEWGDKALFPTPGAYRACFCPLATCSANSDFTYNLGPVTILGR